MIVVTLYTNAVGHERMIGYHGHSLYPMAYLEDLRSNDVSDGAGVV